MGAVALSPPFGWRRSRALRRPLLAYILFYRASFRCACSLLYSALQGGPVSSISIAREKPGQTPFFTALLLSRSISRIWPSSARLALFLRLHGGDLWDSAFVYIMSLVYNFFLNFSEASAPFPIPPALLLPNPDENEVAQEVDFLHFADGLFLIQ